VTRRGFLRGAGLLGLGGAAAALSARVSGAAAAKPAAISSVDVAKILDAKVAKLPNKPNWRESIADLLFVLDLDHSLEARKKLDGRSGSW